MIAIPSQLCTIGYRFILAKKNEKIPVEKDWQSKNNYAYNDVRLSDWLRAENNYGVLCGSRGLVILDFDTIEKWNELKDKLPETFTVQSATRGLPHLYYHVIGEIQNLKLPGLDIRSRGAQVIGARSIINKKTYTVTKDVAIATLKTEELYSVLGLEAPRKERTDYKKIIGGVEQGNRNDSLFKLACSLKSRGVGKDEVLAELMSVNERSKPPLPEREIKTIVNSAFTYPEEQKEEKKRKPDEIPIIQKSFHTDEENLYEQIYKEGISTFVKYNRKTEEITYTNNIQYPDKIIIPMTGQELDKEAILLPSGILEYGTTEQLDADIKQHIHTWLDVDEQYETFATWNIRFSYLYDKFNTLNYTRALGDTGTGKSRLLDVLGNISYKPMRVSGALTPAVIFRIIDKWGGTLCIDEGDQKSSEETDAFIKILNCGYEKNRNVMRMNKEKMEIETFKVYCPKVITTRSTFQDKATEARCMTVIMKQTSRRDIPDILTKKYYKESEELRNKLLLYRLRNYDKINPEIGLDTDLNEFEPRLRQVNRGFIGLFSENSEQIKMFRAYLVEYQRGIVEERSESIEGMIINALAQLINLGHTNITPSDIAEYINQHDTPMFNTTSRSVGKKCKALNITFKRTKIQGSTVNCLDENIPGETFENLFQRYVADPFLLKDLQENFLKNQKGYVVTFVTLPMDTAAHVTEEGLLTTDLNLADFPKNAKKSVTVSVTNVTNVTNVTSALQNSQKINMPTLPIVPEMSSKVPQEMEVDENISDGTPQETKVDLNISSGNQGEKNYSGVANLTEFLQKNVSIKWVDAVAMVGEKTVEKMLFDGELFENPRGTLRVFK